MKHNNVFCSNILITFSLHNDINQLIHLFKHKMQFVDLILDGIFDGVCEYVGRPAGPVHNHQGLPVC